MREIMEKALERFYPPGMREVFGAPAETGNSSYFAPEGVEMEVLYLSQAELYRHPGDFYVLDFGFYNLKAFSGDFQATYRIKFRLSDLEAA